MKKKIAIDNLSIIIFYLKYYQRVLDLMRNKIKMINYKKCYCQSNLFFIFIADFH